MKQLAGILPAAVTPLDDRGEVREESFKLLLSRFYQAGCHGVYVAGQTGEGLQLPNRVRERLVEVAVGCTPAGRAVVVHVGAGSTAEAVGLARHAYRSGAAAISSLPPLAASSFGEVKGYYEALAGATPLPLLVYYFPEFSNAIRSLEQILELCAIPNVVGLKFTDFDLYRLSRIERGGRVIFNGRDEVLAAGLFMGAHGGIGSFYNLVPELFVEVYEHCRARRWSEARAVQDRINDLIQAVLQFPMHAAVKRLLSWSGVDCGVPAPPRSPLTEAEERALRLAVAAAGFDAAGFLPGTVLDADARSRGSQSGW